ncbi:L-glutamate gamma-semialdehyde dehydrogenase [Egibacter rhizosphaerae]|uniref:L-glutamate gamma-semialdehyde dehydrogenase n=1 Tax=Egibacter rhizosphaerae TaxID=1670831 RepID=A0A411YI20_9ACTN|nr:L-glutamate gamma-semialdehyde dehydrogenase [Egibacter rhizosphaerae]QBI20975.1 L-glutamate gamma-semialdehyde dehydrogenase [Egibacter rhizosphaerae]
MTFRVPAPYNEPMRAYAPGSAERAALSGEIERLRKERVDAPCVIGGQEVRTGEVFTARSPHDHTCELADVHAARQEEVEQAIDAAREAKAEWSRWSFAARAAVFLKAADLLSGPWRPTINGATILHQGKSVHQAEIEAVAEFADFLRFNVAFAQQLYEQQPYSPEGVWNRMEYRPLEGFVLAITPFNFTAIAGNLPTAPALMGNTVVWKPSEKQAYAAHFTMEMLRAAGLPDGVINLVHGDGALATDVATAHPELGGVHFTGSIDALRSIWKKVGAGIDHFSSFPRVVGESGGKDFVVAHPTADVPALVVALGRGAFEYQGQKCSAASRAYIPRSLWPEVRDGLADLARQAKASMGDVSDLSTFMGAVIDRAAFEKHRDAIEGMRADGAEIIAGGGTDETDGWFVDPTVIVTTDPQADTMQRELFGPILTVYVYDDPDWDDTLALVDRTSQYALTGAVFSQDRAAGYHALDQLRDAAGNIYLNDKPTGSVVGQQPFGGARMSGTNDKAGSLLNITRWTSARAIKENFVPPHDWRYPHMG